MAKKKQMENETELTAAEEIGEPLMEDQAARADGETADAAGDEEKTYVLTAEEFETARKHIETVTKERDDMIALLQRNQADFDNYRRRNASISADSYDEGKRDTLRGMLSVLDCFDRALENEETEAEAWRDGIKLIVRQLHEQLAKLGLCEVEADGMFDPSLHDAVMQEAVEGQESGKILAVLQKGYRVGDRILRHSMVKVAE